jgi:hypothetical protein
MNQPKQGEAHGWNVDQILVYIWQQISQDMSEQEYPYAKFSNSEMGKRLRLELAALAASPQEQQSVAQARLEEAKEWDTTAHYHISRWPELQWRKERLAKLEEQARQPAEAQDARAIIENLQSALVIDGGRATAGVPWSVLLGNLLQWIETGQQAAYQRGQKAMVEKAAQICEKISAGIGDEGEAVLAMRKLADLIRSLAGAEQKVTNELRTL